jgi:hypothetical protein
LRNTPLSSKDKSGNVRSACGSPRADETSRRVYASRPVPGRTWLVVPGDPQKIGTVDEPKYLKVRMGFLGLKSARCFR